MTSSTTAIHRHLAVCPFPVTSHLPQMLLLSRKIAAAAAPGLHISFFTTGPTAAALSAGLAEEGGSIRIHPIDSGLAAGAPAPASPLEAIQSFVEVAADSLRKGMAAAEEEVGVKIGCVVADGMMTFACREIAEERGVKWVAMWTPSAGSLAAHMHTDLLRRVGGQGIEAHKDKTVDEYIPGFPPMPIADLPPEISAVDNSFSRILHLMSLHLPKVAAVAVNSFDALEPAAANILHSAFPNKFLLAGSFGPTLSAPESTKDPHGCLPWLDTHTASTVVYISFGSGHVPPLEEFASLAEALEASRVPFLWSLPDRFLPYLPEGFIERTTAARVGKVVPWAPQISVLRHRAIGAQVTHCVWNSVLEGIEAGIPMICRPMRIADLVFNARLVYDVWGVGVEIEGGRMTKAAMMAALERVLKGEEGKRLREKIRVMNRLVKEVAVEPDGSSTLKFNKFFNIITT